MPLYDVAVVIQTASGHTSHYTGTQRAANPINAKWAALSRELRKPAIQSMDIRTITVTATERTPTAA